ncbi:hypothetical protein FBR05_00380 [Deltaproteobacteria bacterium PRO3]|nr:hypothetical protein [Deltaproteobacteria bacterium PRO3]
MTQEQKKVNLGGLSLLKPAVNTTAFLKAGIHGFAGSGKTFTATELAIGLSKEIGDGKPVAFFDTETGSDYVISRFTAAGIQLLVHKGRAFKDLITFMQEAQQVCSVAIIDSISHVWTELREAYERKKNRQNGLLFQDWGPIKAEWRHFTDLYLNARLHAIICGRAGYEYDFEKDESGKKDLVKTGTKMKAEGEFGYEPSLSLEMERIPAEGKGFINRCTVLKDRTNTMNGKWIDYPKYKDFRTVVNFLNIKGDHLGLDTSTTSEDLFESTDHSWARRQKQTEITLDLIKSEFVEADLDGTGIPAKKARIALLEEVFGTKSWEEVTTLRLEDLQAGLDQLKNRDLNAWRVNFLKGISGKGLAEAGKAVGE